MRWLILLCLTATFARAEGERPGEFDYYVLSLSWSPSWCAVTGDARRSPQCDPERDFGWVLHGLWPQNTRGYPSFCHSATPPPSRAMTAAMADVMGTGGSAWHQWKKHGVCSGLSAPDYFALAREAYGRITRPEVLRKLDKPVTLPASLIEQAFIRDNPVLEPDMITITCKDARIQEARVCLSKSLDPVPCGQDVVRDCRMKDALFDPVR
ncbi:ribonuclease T2 family protein [Puniceibacterium sediminis]|uniref:Ribonuclease T2 n=1 Tax=Puniceibacterium sediminis TaxID=1608407 RepID=A0A238USJ0_9RHOB|nr:ribonuclease T2 [Puniceibacterium sediminis]SNR24986.1 ribonuclease T2 [Puniceibacterium sediminis]